MRIAVLFLPFLFVICNSGYSQFSLEAGHSRPIGQYAASERGSAGFGILGRIGWDDLISEKIGVATGMVAGGNRVKEGSQIFDAGSSWSFFVIEAGVFFKPIEAMRIKGLIVNGFALTPGYTRDFEIPSTTGEPIIGTATSRDGSLLSLGMDLRLEYGFDKFFLSTNLMYYNKNFGLEEEQWVMFEKKQLIMFIGINLGFRLGKSAD